MATSNDPFYKLIEQQTKIFEEFGKQMIVELQKSYQEYLKHENVKTEKNVFIEKDENFKVEKNSDEIYQICEKYEEKIGSQAQLIDSLRARIEELETDFIIKNQDFKKFQRETDDLRKEIQSIHDNINKPSVAPEQDIEIKIKKEKSKSSEFNFHNEFPIKPFSENDPFFVTKATPTTSINNKFGPPTRPKLTPPGRKPPLAISSAQATSFNPQAGRKPSLAISSAQATSFNPQPKPSLAISSAQATSFNPQPKPSLAIFSAQATSFNPHFGRDIRQPKSKAIEIIDPTKSAPIQFKEREGEKKIINLVEI